MNPTMLVILIAILAVGIFALGMSLTLIFKGHHIDSEIGTNKHMQARGIKCAAQQIREEDAAIMGRKLSQEECDSYGCATCSEGACVNTQQ